MPFSTREKKLIGGFLGVLAVLFLWYRVSGTHSSLGLIERADNELGVNITERNALLSDEQKEESPEPQEIYVHVTGCVKRPGLYQCPVGTRVADVVDLAGGFTEEADVDYVNLAKKVRDEEKIHVPKPGETPVEVSETANGGVTLININTASSKELEEIPGVGEKTAQRIIEYREIQPFGALEDIKNVPGIGDKKFEEMKNYITY